LSVTGRIDWNNQAAVMEAIDEASGAITGRTGLKPGVAVVLGSGLGAFAEGLGDKTVIPFAGIPHFPKASVEGHGGAVVVGTLGKVPLAVMQGRAHYYEGCDIREVTLPVRALARIGVTKLVLTNACGAVNPDFAPGEFMLIEDHLSMFCPNPLRGVNLDAFGPRFLDMSRAYSPAYIEAAGRAAEAAGITTRRGVYGYWPGPTYETAAEIRAFKALGADVVGQSTVAEAITARHCGMAVLGIAAITNMTCVYAGETSHGEVLEMGRVMGGKLAALLTRVIPAL